MQKRLYRAPMRDRLEARRAVSSDGCWVWQGYCDRDGYGRIGVGGTVRGVHRVAYEEWVGPIPEGLVIDHLCRNRACFNPEHLRVCTNLENLHAPGSQSIAAIHAATTVCPRGHEYTPENTIREGGGGRRCRTCRRARTKKTPR